MKYSHQCILLSTILAFTTEVYAEYYIVYPAPRPQTRCYNPVKVKPVKHCHVKKYHPVKKKHFKRIKHHYVKARPCNTCHISVYYSYPSCPLYVNNRLAACGCGRYCHDEYDFNWDRRTADDVTSELQLD